MRRFVKKVAAAALAIAMLGGTNIVSAAQYNDLQGDANVQVQQNIQKTTITSKMQTSNIVKKTSASVKGATQGTTINATAPAYSTSSRGTYQTANVTDGVHVIPISVKASGVLWVDAKWKSGTGTTRVEVVDSNVKYRYGSTAYVSSSTKEQNYKCGYPVKAGQTFYMLVSNSADASAEVRAYVYSSVQNRTLSTTKWRVSSTYNSDGNLATIYYALTPSKTGTVAVSLKEYGKTSSYGYVTLYDKNKKQISERIPYSTAVASYKAYFGVRKNAKYYVKIDSCYGSLSNGYCYGITYTNTAGTDRALSSKSSAKKLTRKATATSTVFTASNAKSTDWYKFYVSSKRTTQFSLDTSSIKSGDIKISVYAGSKLVGTSTIYQSSNGNTYTITHGTTYGKANAGTYYVKVEKQAKTSGRYKIRYVQ